MNCRQRIAVAGALDVASILLFVVIGRRNHEEGITLGGVAETAAPFLFGLGLAWLAVRAWRRPTSVITGVVIWPVTVLVGMIVRNLVFDEGTATSFVIVTTVFLGATLVGWRAIYRSVTTR